MPKIIVTLREILDAPLTDAWNEYCEATDTNPYCTREGLSPDTEVEISLEDALRWGLIRIP